MGCTASSFSYDTNDNSYCSTMPRRSTPRKRKFSSRVECTVPTDHSSSKSSASTCSSCITPPSLRSSSTPTTKRRSLFPKRPAFPKLSCKDMPKALARLTPRTPETKRTPPTQHSPLTEHSIGYFTGSDDLESVCCSFSYNSFLLYTQDLSGSSEIINSSGSSDSDISTDQLPVSNLKMEILMMRDNIQLMPKTSSPLCARRDYSNCASDEVNYISISPPSDIYCLWRQYLHDAPNYSSGDVTAIPEAISGQFSPNNHPAYSQLQNFECVSAPKRYRPDAEKAMYASTSVPLAAVVPVCGATRSIVSTEL